MVAELVGQSVLESDLALAVALATESVAEWVAAMAVEWAFASASGSGREWALLLAYLLRAGHESATQ